MSGTYRFWLPVILAVAAACNGGVSPGTGGSSRVLLTDDPFPYYRLQRVDIYVVSVSASLGADTGGVGSAGGQFITIATPARRINVLALQNGATDELGTVDLPSGAITAVRMVIDTDSSSITLRDGRVLTGTSTPGINWQVGTPRPTLNAVIHEQIAVPDTGAVIVIDFDVGTSFILPQEVDPASTDSGFIFAPQFRAVDANRTGSIAGAVRAQSGGGQPVADASLQLYLGYPQAAENTWWRVGTTSATTGGTFRFSFVTRSDWWATTSLAGVTYFVAVDPPPGSGLGRTVVGYVHVDPGQETALGTVVLH
jgi:hypothetical protein